MPDGLQAAGLASVTGALRTLITHIGVSVGGTEPVGNNYGRMAVVWDTAIGGLVTNDGEIDSAIASGSWGTLTKWSGYDAGSGGNEVLRGALTNALTVAANGYVHFADQAIAWTAA
jgi:hypothetical protein